MPYIRGHTTAVRCDLREPIGTDHRRAPFTQTRCLSVEKDDGRTVHDACAFLVHWPDRRSTAECSNRAPLGTRPIIAPLAAERYTVHFTIPKATHDKRRRVQDLMRHTNPTGDPAVVFDRALTLLLEQLEKTKLGQARGPRTQGATRSETRHVPAAVKREVWARDGGRCAFVGEAVRCSETGFLEYHHVVPFADGGETSAANIQLRCRAHNAYEGEKWFGALIVRERLASCANWFRNG